jgi:hypothetical protein
MCYKQNLVNPLTSSLTLAKLALNQASETVQHPQRLTSAKALTRWSPQATFPTQAQFSHDSSS